MKHALACLIALALLLAMEHPSSADGPDSAQPQQSRLSACLATEAADVSIALAGIAGCASIESSAHAPDLCPTPEKRIDTSSYRDTNDLLIAPSTEPKELCAIEVAIAKSQRECANSPKDGSSALVLDLLRFLAGDWRREGNLPRADALYCEAYRQAVRDGSVSGKVTVLQEWAFLMVQLDEAESAKELVLQQAALARDEYQSDRSSRFATDTLIDALTFQVRIFERLKLPESARAARDEAEQLSAHLPPCNGICDEKTERIE